MLLETALATILSGQQLNCWDGTFAYNTLEVTEENGLVKFSSSSGLASVYANLLPQDGDLRRWGQTKFEFSAPVADCSVSQRDPKTLSCYFKELEGLFISNALPYGQAVVLKQVIAQVRKVEVAVKGGDVLGYEFTIHGGLGGKALIQVPFFHEAGIGNGQISDQKDYCKLVQRSGPGNGDASAEFSGLAQHR